MTRRLEYVILRSLAEPSYNIVARISSFNKFYCSTCRMNLLNHVKKPVFGKVNSMIPLCLVLRSLLHKIKEKTQGNFGVSFSWFALIKVLHYLIRIAYDSLFCSASNHDMIGTRTTRWTANMVRVQILNNFSVKSGRLIMKRYQKFENKLTTRFKEHNNCNHFGSGNW